MRARRLALDAGAVHLIAEIQLERIAATLAAQRPEVAVVDSIQTLWSEALQSAPGSVAQLRECTAQLARHAKKSGTALFIIGHVTKEGAIAGPRVLEHIVDTVLYFEGDPHSSFRLVRAVKNRFGAVNELGVFAMTDRAACGRQNPQRLPFRSTEKNVAGSCVLATLEGTRRCWSEIRPWSTARTPIRAPVGRPRQNRLPRCCSRCWTGTRASPWEQDVFVNAVGGVRIGEPAADLLRSLAIVSFFDGQADCGKNSRVRRSGPGRRSPPGAARPGPTEGGRQARLREGDHPEGQPAEVEDRRDRSDRRGARGPGGPGIAQSLAQTGGGLRSAYCSRWCQYG
jgi:DNA repair protein RadA/Sms